MQNKRATVAESQTAISLILWTDAGEYYCIFRGKYMMLSNWKCARDLLHSMMLEQKGCRQILKVYRYKRQKMKCWFNNSQADASTFEIQFCIQITIDYWG